MRLGKSRVFVWSLVCSVLVSPYATAARGHEESSWDVTSPRGRTRTIDFETTEGTWMSVDLSPDGRWVVFDLLGHVYRVDSRGGDAECLTQSSGIAMNYHPRVSPDGKRIAFVSDRSGQDNLWVMGIDGSDPTPVFLDDFTRAVEPAWTPDGKAVVFTRRMRTELGLYRTHDRIWMVPASGGEGRIVAGSAFFAPLASEFEGDPRYQSPSVSPDGRFIYYSVSKFAGNDRRIERVDLTTGQVDRVTASTLQWGTGNARAAFPLHMGDLHPLVSPNGRWLAFARRIPTGRLAVGTAEITGRTALWLRDLVTGAEKIVMDPITSDGMAGHPPWLNSVLPGYAWSRDSASIVITRGGKIRRLDIETGAIATIEFRARVHRVLSEMARSRIRIDDESFDVRAIRWPASSPSGRHLVFEGVGQLWVMKLPQGQPEALTSPQPNGVELMPSWSPDGQWVAYTTSELNGIGHVYKIGVGRRRAVRLTTNPGIYRWPLWSRDGQSVLVQRWPSELDRPAKDEGNEWELVKVPASGGAIGGTLKLRALSPGTVLQSGRVAFNSRREDRKLDIVSIDERVPGRAIDLTFKSFVKRAALSPDERWIAVEWMHDVYLLRNPKAVAAKLDPVDLSAPATGVRRLSKEGGAYVRWRNDHVLEFASGHEYLTHDVSTDRTVRTRIALSLPRDRPAGTLVLRGARLITMDRRKVIEKGDLVLADGRIRCVGACSYRDTDRVVDATGMTIMPGIVDHHGHHLSKEVDGAIERQRASSGAYLAYGVTTVLDPFARDLTAFTIGEMIEYGRIVGPRTFTTGSVLLCMDEGAYDEAQRDIRTLADAREHVNRQVKLGAVAIKDYKLCTRTARQLVAEAAREAGVSVIAEAGDLFYNLGLIAGGHTGWEHPVQHAPIYRDVATFLGQAGAHYTPNLLISDFPHGSALEYWFSQAELWSDEKEQLWFPWRESASRRVFIKKPLREYAFPILAQGTAAIKRAGGYIAVGDHGERTGRGSHWELWSLALGMTPMEALEAATIDGARYLGVENEIGSLSTGKLADLLILNSNPLDDIRSSMDIRYVMKAGRLYDGKTLDEVWPRNRPYGERPWHKELIFRNDAVAD